MTSWLIDLVLLAALGLTAWRTGAMLVELRRLRAETSAFRAALAEADGAIDRAAHAVVAFKGEGETMLAALEAKSADARRAGERLDHAIRSADLRVAFAERLSPRSHAA